MITIDADKDNSNADWTKNTWDLPYESENELKTALGNSYEHFKTLPAYKNRPWK